MHGKMEGTAEDWRGTRLELKWNKGDGFIGRRQP